MLLIEARQLCISRGQSYAAEGDACPVLLEESRKLQLGFSIIECSYHSAGTSTKITACALRSPKVKGILREKLSHAGSTKHFVQLEDRYAEIILAVTAQSCSYSWCNFALTVPGHDPTKS